VVKSAITQCVRGCVLLSGMIMLAGCAELAEPPSAAMTRLSTPTLSLGTDQSVPLTQSSGELSAEVRLDESSATSATVAAQSAPSASGPKAAAKPRTQEERAVDDEFIDPFAKAGEQSLEIEEYDPWENFNVAIFNFNRKVDRYVLKPVATVYDFIVPDEIELGIRRMFYNVRFVPRMLNNLFQGKFKGAGIEMGRFLINSSLGLGGYLDFAKEVFGLETPPEDFGQTLGVYGVKPGRFLVLPIPPFVTTTRDLVGYIGDFFLDPWNYLVFPSIELNGAPSVIGHTHRLTTTFSQLGLRTGDVVNERSINLESFQGVEDSTVDLYGAVRNAYLQQRARSIRQ
jgi:phospholipid-binding lipoprotein MlaA